MCVSVGVARAGSEGLGLLPSGSEAHMPGSGTGGGVDGAVCACRGAPVCNAATHAPM